MFRNNLLGTSLIVQWLRINLPNAGDACLIPGPGRFYSLPDNEARASQLLSPHTQQEKPLQWEGLVPQLESSPPLTATRESQGTAARPHASLWRPRAAKNNDNNNNNPFQGLHIQQARHPRKLTPDQQLMGADGLTPQLPSASGSSSRGAKQRWSESGSMLWSKRLLAEWRLELKQI